VFLGRGGLKPFGERGEKEKFTNPGQLWKNDELAARKASGDWAEGDTIGGSVFVQKPLSIEKKKKEEIKYIKRGSKIKKPFYFKQTKGRT